MSAFVQTLLQGSAGLAATITISGSKPVTAGNDIYVLLAVQSQANGFTCTDNLGNTYVVVHDFEGPLITNSRQALLHARITAGGTLTSQTISWSNSSSQSSAGSVEVTDAVTPAQDATDSNGGSTSASLTIGSVSGVLLWTQAMWRAGSLGVYVPPTGYTTALIQDAGNIKAVLAYKIGASSGVLTATWDNNAEWTAVHTDAPETRVAVPQVIRYER